MLRVCSGAVCMFTCKARARCAHKALRMAMHAALACVARCPGLGLCRALAKAWRPTQACAQHAQAHAAEALDCTCDACTRAAVCATCLQGESSTGTHQALGDGLGDACKAAGTLLVVDTVASLGGVPVFADAWGIDASYSGSQKCLSAPPGAAPLFFSQRAVDKLHSRKTKPATYNLDLNLIGA